MVLRHFFERPSRPAEGGPTTPDRSDEAAEGATVRRIVGQLAELPPDRARWLAGFAFVLGRMANADLVMTADETRVMEQIVREHGGLTEAQAVLVVEIAKQQERLFGETEDYVVTREWASEASPEDRLALLRCCFMIAAIDDSIVASESAVLNEIGQELLLDEAAVGRVRREYADRFEAVRAMRRSS